MRRKLPELDDRLTFIGILLGIFLGGLYALLHIKERGAVRRRDLSDFGAGSRELEMQARLDAAKARAKKRLDEGA